MKEGPWVHEGRPFPKEGEAEAKPWEQGHNCMAEVGGNRWEMRQRKRQVGPRTR